MNRIPSLLAPYLEPSDKSLILLTSVLDASCNWLLLRFLLSVCGLDRTDASSHHTGKAAGRPVVFLSFLRSFRFWRDGCQKLGLNLEALLRAGTLIYLDGLEGSLPPNARSPNPVPGLELVNSSEPRPLEDQVVDALQRVKQSSHEQAATLIVDGLDYALAANEASAAAYLDLVYRCREHCHSVIVSAAADLPFLMSPSTPLELQHAILATELAHQAQLIMSVRPLDTGAARDVSGVLRISRGSCSDESTSNLPAAGSEVLYHVRGDGDVRVFERGSHH